MQKQKSKSPEIRFKQYTDAWEQRKFKDFITKTGEKNKAGEDYPAYSVSNSLGLIPQSEQFEGSRLGGLDKSAYKFVKPDEFAYNPARINVGSIAFNDLGKTVIVSSLYVVIYMNEELDNEFALQYIKSPEFLYEVKRNTEGSVREYLFYENFSNVKIPYTPKIEEQKKIGAFFKDFDTLITLHQRKLEILKNSKKSLVQKMFPKKGQEIPEVRFPGFTGAWEQRKLSEMISYKNGKGHEDRQSDNGKYELVNLNSISIDGGLKHSGKFVDVTSDTLLENDLVMVLSDVGHGDLLGRVALIPENDRFVLNQRVALLRPFETVDPQFMFSYINANQQYFKSQGAGMSQLNISKGSVENFTSYVPNKEEQTKIGAFFNDLDNLITLHQCKLETLKEYKKTMLQKMFI